MQRRIFLKKTTIGVGAVITSNLLLAGSLQELPNIMLLGDSVSLGYTNYVKEKLDGKVNFFRPLNIKGGYVNCGGTTDTIKHIDDWLALAPKWDVIHFNFGLHDLKHVDAVTGKNSKKPEDPQQADLKTYKKNLTEIVKKLKATNAKLIFATTTSYPDKPAGPLRRSDQPEKYNKVALKIMKKYDVTINDLNALTLPRLAELQPPSNVHFTKEGSEVLGKQVVDKILTTL
jgi:lysophospholipase L1-like esterase